MSRVLLVDDDPAIVRLLEVNFRLEGFETWTASGGPEALALAADVPDAIVLDVMLPGMDGHEVFRRLREDPATASIPVVFLSARTHDPDAERDVAAVYVSKPFDPVTLIETVRTAIEGAG